MRYVRRLAALIITVCACASASAAVITATNTTYGVIDGSEATRVLAVDVHGTITDVNITVEFSKCDNPPIGPNGRACVGRGSPFESEFSLVLVGPNGQSATLVDSFDTYTAGTVGSGVGRVLVTFDDEAAAAAGPRVRAGTFRPEDMLSAFDGMDLFGSWTLFLQDDFPADPLEFFSTSLEIAYEPAPVPEPATLAMLGLGLGLMGMRAARKP
ncbi:PEP-CTERM sorting domain-containing protein [Massilia sp. CMS3.1]|uniref:PEP-CTERM sorting domain-containing protein n=1 Tax=Massilia sp. CMS3.1 TaxID=3373083 RepID=UPI003EE5F62B